MRNVMSSRVYARAFLEKTMEKEQQQIHKCIKSSKISKTTTKQGQTDMQEQANKRSRRRLGTYPHMVSLGLLLK